MYQEYQKRLKSSNALDFDDLIVKTVELFRNCPDVLEYYQDRFRYIMVCLLYTSTAEMARRPASNFFFMNFPPRAYIFSGSAGPCP